MCPRGLSVTLSFGVHDRWHYITVVVLYSQCAVEILGKHEGRKHAELPKRKEQFHVSACGKKKWPIYLCAKDGTQTKYRLRRCCGSSVDGSKQGFWICEACRVKLGFVW